MKCRIRMIHCRDMTIQNFRRWRPAAILDLIETEIVLFDPPTVNILGYNETWSGWPVALMAIRNSTYHPGAFGPPVWGKGGRRESSIIGLPFERAMVVSSFLQALHCHHCTISCALGCNLLSRMSATLKSTHCRVGHFCQTYREIIFEEFQPMW